MFQNLIGDRHPTEAPGGNAFLGAQRELL